MAVTQNTYTGNGSNTNFSITFEYLKQADVKASIDGTATTAFTFSNATTLSFTTAPANGSAIRIFRDTDVSSLKATFFPGSAIKAEDLNDNFTQNNFATQETVNDVVTANTTANTAKTTADAATVASNTATTTANAATTTANTALTNSSNAVTTANSAQTTVTTYVHDGTNPAGDGVGSNPQGLAYAINTANTASTNSSNAVTTANTADTNATAALNNSRESDGQGGFTSSISKSNTAISTANTALTNASSAVTTANAATATASTANTNASNAVATANAAAAAVANAAFYSPIAALANLPSSPANEDRVEMTNSTGVESSSAVSGVPSGFVGASTLSVRLEYNSSTSKWEYQQYFANDPDERYATNYLAVIKGDGTSSGQVGKITLNCSNNNHGVSIQSPPHSAGATYTLTLPTGTGTNGQFLSTNGSGVLSWGTVDLSTRLALAGGTMTGALTLSGAPTANLHAATKQYVDDNAILVADGGNFDNGASLVSTSSTFDGGSF